MQHDPDMACPSCAEPLQDGALPKNFALRDLRVDLSDADFLRADAAELADGAGACPVCLDGLADKAPLLLGCGHTVCAECVLGLALRGRGGSARCPLCVRHTSLPHDLRLNASLRDALRDLLAIRRRRATAARRWRRLVCVLRAVVALRAAAVVPKETRSPGARRVWADAPTADGRMQRPAVCPGTTAVHAASRGRGWA